MSRVLAADVGGTNIRLAVIDQSGRILGEQRIKAELARHDADAPEQAESFVLQTLGNAFAEMLGDEPACRIGIGFPGFFRGDSGVLVASPNLPQLKEFALAKRLGESLGLPVTAQNDGLCAAIGEHRFGIGRGHPNLLHITLGTGVGAGLILDHKPWTGEGGMAMEFGHLRSVRGDNARRCGCGGKGCVETFASATAVSERYFEASNTWADAQGVHDKAMQGDIMAREIIAEAGMHLGAAIAETVKLLDIRTVTVSGGLTNAWDMLQPPLQRALDDNVIAPQRGRVTVMRSSLGDAAGIFGAAALALGD